MVHLLLVEDEYRLAVCRPHGHREKRFAVDTAARTELAHERIVESDYDLVLLDFGCRRLSCFALHDGQALSRGAVAQYVWDAAYDAQSNAIDVIVARFRHKLGGAPDDRVIHTISGVGYVLRGGGEIP